MEKCKSCPQYPCAYTDARFGSEDHCNSYSFNGPTEKFEGFAASNDPELQRKKRVASYNMYTMKSKLKSTVMNSFKWIKNKLTDHSQHV